MKVFISWSGERSRQVAVALRDWLPDVIQAIEPFMSQQDIPKGARWGIQLPRELEGTSVGIVCLTAENLTAPWILFEAGALSKTVEQTLLCTYLLGLEPINLSPPLSDFQATRANAEETLQMLLSINAALGKSGLSPEKAKRAFDRWWPALEEKLQAIPPSEHPVEAPKVEDMVAEILRYVRAPVMQTSRSDGLRSLELCALQGRRVTLETEMQRYQADLQAMEKETIASGNVERLGRARRNVRRRIESLTQELARLSQMEAVLRRDLPGKTES